MTPLGAPDSDQRGACKIAEGRECELTNPKPTATGIMKLKEPVDYQSGAVVSKTLVDEEGGTLTAFAFDEGEGPSEHTAPHRFSSCSGRGDEHQDSR